MNRPEIVEALLTRMGYDEERPGLKPWQTIVIGYSTDMAFVKDASLPFNRVAYVDGREQTVTIEAPANGVFVGDDGSQSLTFDAFKVVLDELIV